MVIIYSYGVIWYNSAFIFYENIVIFKFHVILRFLMITIMVLPYLKWHNICFYCSDISCDIYNGVSEFLMTVTVLQHLRLHKWFTFSEIIFGPLLYTARDSYIPVAF